MEIFKKTEIEFQGVNEKKKVKICQFENDETKDLYLSAGKEDDGDFLIIQRNKQDGSIWIEGNEIPASAIQQIINFLI